MPSKTAVPHLEDILENIGHIQRLVGNITIEEYTRHRDTSAAVERYLQIITEAAYRLRDTAEIVCPGPNWKGWRDLGNILRHAYDRVDNDLVWATLSTDIPLLKAAVQVCLDHLRGSDSAL